MSYPAAGERDLLTCTFWCRTEYSQQLSSLMLYVGPQKQAIRTAAWLLLLCAQKDTLGGCKAPTLRVMLRQKACVMLRQKEHR